MKTSKFWGACRLLLVLASLARGGLVVLGGERSKDEGQVSLNVSISFCSPHMSVCPASFLSPPVSVSRPPAVSVSPRVSEAKAEAKTEAAIPGEGALAKPECGGGRRARLVFVDNEV